VTLWFHGMFLMRQPIDNSVAIDIIGFEGYVYEKSWHLIDGDSLNCRDGGL
jgi:hypothetical protein